MITRDQVIPLLLEACPSFQAAWDDHRQYYGEEILYVALGDLATHLLQLHREHRTESFSAVTDAIERLHIEGDSYVREAATIGLLESIQNVWSNNDVDPEVFAGYLHPISAKW